MIVRLIGIQKLWIFCICKSAFACLFLLNCTVLDSLSSALATKFCLQAQHVTYREDRWRRTSEGNPVHFTMARCECPNLQSCLLSHSFHQLNLNCWARIFTPVSDLPARNSHRKGWSTSGWRSACGDYAAFSVSAVPISRSVLRVVMVVQHIPSSYPSGLSVYIES